MKRITHVTHDPENELVEFTIWSEDAEFKPGQETRYVGPKLDVSVSDGFLEFSNEETTVLLSRPALRKFIQALKDLECTLKSEEIQALPSPPVQEKE